ncbi:MAG: cell division protein ZapA [Proteobacteria bacterium]|nr:cell division protein ZapA [Pseudomonadota bacterium]
MAQVTLQINGYSYLVGCEDGQEGHLKAMGDAVQTRIDSIKALGQTGEARLLMLASLLLADELHDKEAALRTSRQAERIAAASAQGADRTDPAFDAAVRRLALKAEEIAEALERT